MRPEDFQNRFTVSRETLQRLETYHALLLKWQKAVNLVGPGTIPEAWERHFADSAQLAAMIPDTVKIIADLGSGAGFPGMVLAIMRPDLEVHLVESDEKKCQFLKTVSRETGVKAHIHTERIENMTDGFLPELVTARALASLDKLLDMCVGWAGINPGLQLLFLKGRGAEDEIVEAKKSFDFAVESILSQTDKDARILNISGLRPRV
jgi:16S rRNA (guanine527-N7)-methyltransferase